MNGVALGPLVLDASRLAFIAAVITFLVIAEFRGFAAASRKRWQSRSTWAFAVLVAWIIGARVGFVLANSASFAAQPWDAVKLWQGGFVPWIGAGFAAAMIAFASLRQRANLMPLALGAVAAAGVFFAMNNVFSGSAPDLPGGTFEALRGSDVTLEDIDGPVVINLWATWCPPCRREMPMMLDVAAQSEGAAFVFANQGEDVAQIGRFLASEGLAADHIVLDRQMTLMNALGAKGLPATLIFDRHGALVQSHTGEISRAVLERALGQIAAGAP